MTAGTAVTLSWTTENADNVSIDNGVGAIALNGSRPVTPTQSTTYTLTASGPDGTVTCNDRVTVSAAPVVQLPLGHHDGGTGTVSGSQCAVYGWAYDPNSASPINVHIYIDGTYQTGTILTSVRADDSRPDVAASIPGAPSNTGFVYTLPSQYHDGQQHTYYVYAINSNGVGPNPLLASSPRTMTCTAPVLPLNCTLSASASTINAGGVSTLSWTTQGATSVSINQGIGLVSFSGSRSVTLSQSTTYTLTATAADGRTTTCVKTIAVNTPAPIPSCLITADSNPIALGSATTIRWSTTNAVSGSLNQGLGSATVPTGSRSVSPTAPTTYVLTVANADGVTRTCQVSLNVVDQPVPPPVCALNASPATITAGGASTLSWTTSGATSVSINQGIGPVGFGGSQSVSPTQTTTYVLTATGAGGITTCTRTITVPTPVPAPICNITATPTTLPAGGGSTTFSWTSENGQSAAINNGVGSVALNGSRPVTVTQSGTYTLTVTAADGRTANCSQAITVGAVPPAPLCTFTATPTNLPAGGGTVTFNWTSQNGASASINNGFGTVVLNGSQPLNVTQSATYTFTVTAADGRTANCSQAITVGAVPPAPACTLSLSPTSITSGQSSTLTWNMSNANSASIDQGIGAVTANASGTRVVNPTQNTTYTLTTLGANNQQVTCVATLTVTPVAPLTCDAFTASPGTLVGAGTTTLTWNTTSATSVSINNGVGSVAVDGSQAVLVSTSTTFTLTATNGVDNPVTCQAPVTVTQTPVVVPRCDAFTVSPTSVRRGSTATLSWSTTNATNVSINNGVGTVALDGSSSVTVNNDTTYTLTATNGAATDSCQTTVRIEGGGGGGGGSNSPRCTLTASDKSIKSGDRVTLKWKTQRTNDIILKDNHGKTIVNSKKDSDIDEDEGSVVVRPTRSTAYTLTAIRGTKDRDCTVDINVSGVTVSSTRTLEPLVAGISLSQLPYTGFDAGPVLTTIFYALIALWAAGIGYVLVLKRGPITPAFGAALAGATAFRKQSGDAATKPNPTLVRESVMGSVHVPAVEAPYALPVAAPSSVVGYESFYDSTPASLPVAEEGVFEIAPVVTDEETLRTTLKERAQDMQALISTDAVNFIIAQGGDETAATELLDMIVDVAKATYPKEDGWVMINKERIIALAK